MGMWRLLLAAFLIGAAAPAVAQERTTQISALSQPGVTSVFVIGGEGQVRDAVYDPSGRCLNEWSPPQGAGLQHISAVANHDGRGEVLAIGGDGRVWNGYQTSFPAESWHYWDLLDGNQMRRVAAARNREGRLAMYVLGGDDAVYSRIQSSKGGSWLPWGNEGFTMRLRDIAATVNARGDMQLFGITRAGVLVHRRQTTQDGAWSAWTSLEGHDLSKVAAGRNADGRLEVYAVGGDGRVYRRIETSPGAGAFAGWSGMGGEDVREIAAASLPDNRLAVFTVNASGSIHHSVRTAQGDAFSPWRPLGGCAASTVSYQLLAAYWAPVISQDVDSANIRADYITRIDYDVDLASGNSWANLWRFPLPAWVYYWVSETENYYFIGYGFFHPRDWTSRNRAFPSIDYQPADGTADEHNNDMEGVMLALSKSGGPFGGFIAMLTQAHGPYSLFTDKDTPPGAPNYADVAPARAIAGNAAIAFDGDVDFVVDGWGTHPVVYVEAEGHGVYGDGNKHGVGNVDDWAPFFEDERVTDWRSASWTGMPYPMRSGAPGQNYNRDGWGDGVIYHFEAMAEAPAPSQPVPSLPTENPTKSLPHDWQIIGYDLIDIRPLWDNQSNGLVFGSDGKFSGGAANPPWGWGGDFFKDPAREFNKYFKDLVKPADPQPVAYRCKSWEPVQNGCPGN